MVARGDGETLIANRSADRGAQGRQLRDAPRERSLRFVTTGTGALPQRMHGRHE